MATTSEQAINILQDTALLIKKVQINLKKCPKERFTKGYIETRIKTLEEYWNTFKRAHESLVKHTTVDQRGILPYFVNEEFFQTEDLYLHLVADLTDMLVSKTKIAEVAEANNTSSSVGASAQVKLPVIQLPLFTGNYEEFPTYQDMFLSLVDQNPSLSPVQKLHYLKTTVAGEAAALLKHIQVTEPNYAQAWATLRNRYGNLRIIVNSLLRRLFTQRKCTTQSVHMLKSILDTTNECLNTLKNLKICTDSWDPLLIFLVVQKLDPETHRDWEEYAYNTNLEELPTWENLKNFLESKYRTLELITPTAATVREKTSSKERTFHITTSSKQCIKCKGDHTLSHCNEFTKMQPPDRSVFVKNHNMCFNCLRQGHNAMKCRVLQSCRICKRRHHSLLHLPRVVNTSEQLEPIQPAVSTESNVEEVQVNTVVAPARVNDCTVALLATALVIVESQNGHVTTLKALVDKGSQACFISEKAAQLLKLERHHTTKFVTGMESMKVAIKHEVSIQVKSRWGSECNLPVRAYVMSEPLATHIPKYCYTRINQWPHITGLKLADPDYCISGKIDLLLGVREYATILKEGLIKGPPGTPVAQNTSLGWIIFGEISMKNNTLQDTAIVMHQQLETNENEELNMQNLLKGLWEIDSSLKRKLTKEEERCEDIYNKTHKRDSTGRYIVKLPFKTEENKSSEGDTRTIAMNRLLQLERRFKRDIHLKNEYTKVIEEYEVLHHMEKVPTEEINKKCVYLPHHAICREDKESTKTRIVFDASCKGSKGVSLNDELLLGPVLQDDLRSLLMRWRMHPVCFIADINKMYRMIVVDEEHRDFQRILWRSDPSHEVTDYRLLRLTFGLGPAPYLAVRTLFQLAADEGEQYPEAAKMLREDFYVDDLMSGCDTPCQAMQICKDLKELLRKGGFELKKWASNNAELLNSIDPGARSANTHIDLNVDGKVKTLGILWDLKGDKIEYSFPTFSLRAVNITKRTILSEIQKLFDPLGWIAPCLTLAKILIQRLWLESLSWDDELPSPLREEWLKIRADFSNVNELTLNRWLGTNSSRKDSIQLHGFCDASMKAYAATVYCQVEHLDGTKITTLVAAKTRVAPLKIVSLPRLELCGAVLLAQLMTQVGHAMKVPATRIQAWTDSTIVLAWLAGEPSRWKPFVANRTVEILSRININQWHHVLSHDNPADIASRGMLMEELQKTELWWKGPEWLSSNKVHTQDITEFSTELEMRKIQSHLIEEIEIQERKVIDFEKFSTLIELQKTIVYCKRFLNYHREVQNNHETRKAITTEELHKALQICIRRSQQESFEEEIKYIQLKKDVRKNSYIKSLNPYLDEERILRVGGRLRHANISPENKHPIILCSKNKFTYLVVAEAHSKTLHGGVEMMLCYLRSTYWIIRAKNLVKKYIRNCLICAKQSSATRTQKMGDLPKVRVTPARPFSNSGVDFAGPIPILKNKGKGAKTQKAYIALFICMATKAIHLELVSDLGSAAFIAAFKRFCARRGRCTNLWSDQGRNFVGASKELERAWKEVCLDFEGEIAESLAADGTQWHFIPACSPNFGGLWETGVKSLKHHLKRILTTNLTFEELTTVLCQIEACLNSRPLCPIEEGDNIQPLTPGHFLIGEAPIAVPEPSLLQEKTSNLTRWQHLQKILNDFWARWQGEYLTRLQQRPKWQRLQKEMEIGDVVHVKTDNLPPGKWMLGRIVAKHPGPDGLTRIYSVKSGDTITKRPITKLCLLPVNISD